MHAADREHEPSERPASADGAAAPPRLFRPRALAAYLDPVVESDWPAAAPGTFARLWLLVAALLIAGALGAAWLQTRLAAPPVGATPAGRGGARG